MKFSYFTFSRSLSVAVTFAVVSTAIAMTWTQGSVVQAAEEKKMSFLRQNDGDGDMKLSLDEYVNGVVERVSMKTRDRLSKTAKERFQKADQDGDGMTDGDKPMNLKKFTNVSARRITARAAERAAEKGRQQFAALDTNGDSFVDRDEIKAFKK